MQQVLIKLGPVPVYGFGMMLFLTFLACYWLVGRRAEKEGIPRERLHDLAVYLFIGGLIGARIAYMIQYRVPIWDFWRIWEGGLIFYGSALGGLAAYIVAWFFIIRKHRLDTWQLADIIAPVMALGLCIGRVGCLLNGCCYGHVACPNCPQIHFPLSAPARGMLVREGLQTAAGFTVVNPTGDPRSRVVRVQPDSPAAQAGLKSADVIVEVDGVPNHARYLEILGTSEQIDMAGKLIGRPPDRVLARDLREDLVVVQYQFTRLDEYRQARDAAKSVEPPAVIDQYDWFWNYLAHDWPQGRTELLLTVEREADGKASRVSLPAFSPRTLGLHPTQLYETVSAGLLFLLLLAYEPFRRRKGELMIILMLGYAVHRFVNESLRNDTAKVAFDMTLSQNGSIVLFLGGVVLLVLLLRKPIELPVPLPAPLPS
jgi:prolipoprotein diacylglyceryltransferase